MPRPKGPACNSRFMCGDCDRCEPLSFASDEYSANWNNVLNDRTPRQVFKASLVKYWFDCPDCKHTFDASTANICKGRRCPYCSSPTKKLCDDETCEHCLKNSFASHPRSAFLLDESVNARQIFLNSNSVFTFHCDDCNHDYRMSPASIMSKKSNCPFCCKPSKMLCEDPNCDHCFQKSFANHPLAVRWCPTNNKTPRDVFLNSNDKYWLVCPDCGHRYSVTLCDLNRNRTGACLCHHKTEKKLHKFLIERFSEDAVEYQKRYAWCRGTKYPMPFDFVIENIKVIIELDGKQHYKAVTQWSIKLEDIQVSDRFKIEAANKHGYTVIHILQEDVLEDRHDWADKLMKHLHAYDSPRSLTIKTRSPLI